MSEKTTQQEDEWGAVATSTLIGGVATLIQELVVTKVVDPNSLEERLRNFVQQESIQKQPEPTRLLIEDVINMLCLGITIGKRELQDNEHPKT